MGTTSARAKNSWNQSHYDRLTILVQKGEKEKLARIAEEEGVPISRLFVNALNEKYPGLLTTLDKTLPALREKPQKATGTPSGKKKGQTPAGEDDISEAPSGAVDEAPEV